MTDITINEKEGKHDKLIESLDNIATLLVFLAFPLALYALWGDAKLALKLGITDLILILFFALWIHVLEFNGE